MSLLKVLQKSIIKNSKPEPKMFLGRWNRLPIEKQLERCSQTTEDHCGVCYNPKEVAEKIKKLKMEGIY